MRCVWCNSENGDSSVPCSCCGSPQRPDTALTPALPVGTRLHGGLYSIGKVLGQGGFGITYLGSDSGLKRAVAIKEFFPQVQGCSRAGTTVQPGGMIAQADYRKEKNKFLAEGQRLAQFQHPSIVKVFSLFEENNTAYMVMEFLRGKTLLKLVEEDGCLEETDAVAFIEQVAGALDLIHGSKLLHRDIKPENIIITEEGRAVLLDFGTAREFAAGKTRRMTTTLTPGYAPLEQYGQRARFGVFTDIYALGATLYHVLSGEMPIHATDRATGVKLPALQGINPKVSRSVSSAVMWALEMRVDKRPQSIRDFLMAVRGTRPPFLISQSVDTTVSTRAETGRRIAQGMGCVEISLSRLGSFPIDCPVTINVERRHNRYYDK
jgi:F-box protein 11